MTGRYHAFEDVREVVLAFRGKNLDDRLETLRLGSVTLTPELVDLLAREMPELDRLELLTWEIVPRNDEFSLEYTASRGLVEYHIEEFFSEMEKRSYVKWRLRHLTMVLTSLPYRFYSGPDLERHLIRLFTQCVPTVRVSCYCP